MSERHEQENRLSRAYERVLERLEKGAGDLSWESLQREMDDAIEFEAELETYTKDELALLRAWVERDLKDMRHYMSDTGKQVASWLGVDIDQLSRRVAESLLSMKEREGKLREQFIAIVGHDLRNPIAAVSAGLRILSRQKASGEKTEALIPEMQRALNRASQIITNLLDFARGRLGRGVEIDAPHAIDLKPVFSDVVGEIRQIAVQPIEAVFDLLHPIRADPQRLGQLLSNLLGNAILHGAPGEVVKVDCGLDGENLRLSVNNQGKPIPPELQASLFQPFERGGDRDSLQGLGLGLYIASEIARAHKGRIDIESSASKGTTFTLTMPARFE